NGYVVDTGKPNKANPYYLVNQKIEEEVGNLDILRIRRSAHDLEGYTYARFYNLAFDPEHSHEFRTLVLDNLIALLDSENNQLTINTIPVSDFRNLEVFTLRHQNWGI